MEEKEDGELKSGSGRERGGVEENGEGKGRYGSGRWREGKEEVVENEEVRRKSGRWS